MAMFTESALRRAFHCDGWFQGVVKSGRAMVWCLGSFYGMVCIGWRFSKRGALYYRRLPGTKSATIGFKMVELLPARQKTCRPGTEVFLSPVNIFWIKRQAGIRPAFLSLGQHCVAGQL